jgi:hypothetical protein
MKYFEITPSPRGTVHVERQNLSNEIELDEKTHDVDMVPLISASQCPSILSEIARPTPSRSPDSIELQTLANFHHFTTATSSTLPVSDQYPDY